MANRKISEFTALTAPASGDTFAILDVDASGIEVNKKITYANVLGKAPDGTAAAPAFSFNSDTNSGISGGSDTLVLSTGGTAAISVDSSQNVTLSANLTVSGTTTVIDTTTLTVKDKNIEIAKGNGNDAAVDGAGITIDSTDGDKTWNWVDSTDAWTSSENIDLASGKVLKVAGTQVLSATNFTGTSAVATAVTVADESSDTSCNVLFTTAATGNLAPKSGTNLTFNSDTGALTATSFVGALTGTATEATSVTVSANNSTDETVYPVFVDGATGTQGAETDTGLTYNPSSGLLTSTSFAGALTGNVTGNASGSSGSCTGNAATATALATARTIGGTSFDGTANIAVALAATSTALATARDIGGVSFDGTANITLPGVNASGTQDTSGTAALATSFTVTANNSTDETVYPLFADGATGSQGAETDTGLTYNPSTGLLTSTEFSGSGASLTTLNASNLSSGTVNVARLGSGSSVTTKFLRGDNTWQTVSGTPEGTAILSTGESGATKYLREDGDGTCSWQAVPAAVGGASGVDFNDDVKARWGTGNDLEIYHDGSNSRIEDTGTGYLAIRSNNIRFENPAANEALLYITENAGIELYHDNTKRIETSTTGATVTGVATVSNGIVETAITIATNHTITTNYNAMSAGPVTVSATVTVPSGSVWTVI